MFGDLLGMLFTCVLRPVAILTVLLLTVRIIMKTFYHKRSKGVNPKLASATVVVTGGNSGIGKATVNELLLRGSRVIFTGRDVNAVKQECLPEFLKSFATLRAENIGQRGFDPQKALLWEKEVMDGAWDENGNYTSKRLWFRRVDFSDFAQIQTFAEWVKSEHGEIYALVNNAGGIFDNYKVTKYNIEWTIAVNHLSHHLLTDLLLSKISAEGRIINVASLVSEHSAAAKVKEPVDFNQFFAPNPAKYHYMDAYSLSKLANVFFARGVQGLLKSRTPGLMSVSLHPGTVKSNFLNRGKGLLYILSRVLEPLINVVFKTNLEGAQTTLHCLTADELVPGGYYSDCAIRKGNKVATEEVSRAFLTASAKVLENAIGRPLSLLK